VPEELESGVGMEPGTFLPLSLLDRLIIWDRIDAAISRRRLFRKHDSGVHTRQKTTNAMVTLKRLSSAVAPSTLSALLIGAERVSNGSSGLGGATGAEVH